MWVIDVRPGPRILLMSAEIKALLPFRFIGYVEICVLKKAMNKWAKPKIRNKEKQKERKNKRKRKRKNNFRAKNISKLLKNKSEIKSPKICFLDNQESGKLSEHLFKREMATEPTREEQHCNFPRQGLPQTPALPVLLVPDQCAFVGGVRRWAQPLGAH